MTSREWKVKRPAALAEYRADVDAGITDLDFEAWRVTKGYIVTEQKT